jgi:hypothetical protein
VLKVYQTLNISPIKNEKVKNNKMKIGIDSK